MKLLVVSDLHYRLRQFDWIAARARDGAPAIDVVVVAGDLLDIRSAVPLNTQAVAVTAALRSMGRDVVVLTASGNHDLDGRDDSGEKSARWLARAGADGVHVDGTSVVVDDTLFSICPWWDGEHGRKRVGAQLAADAARRPGRWVWVYHAPPAGSPLAWDGNRDYGDEPLVRWVDDFGPDVVLSGHIHQAPFVHGGAWSDRIGTTWLFNPGHQPGPVPTYLLIDLDAGTAQWSSATEREEIVLAS
jgi:Icc-related predicted phosphoesterase